MIPSHQSHIAVWLDSLAPDRGAFPHALEWANRLGWSLCGFLSPWWPPEIQSSSPTLNASTLNACRAACASREVTWEVREESDQKIQTAELCVVSDGLTAAGKNLVIRQVLGIWRTPLLVCPKSQQTLSRMLVLNQYRGGCFLEAVAHLCRLFQVEPVVLTLGSTEPEVRAAQQMAEQLFAAQKVIADFDFAVGYDVPMAVSCAAKGRHCSHVVLEDRPSPPWWRWFWGDVLTQMLALSQTFTVLALPSNSGAGLLSAFSVGHEVQWA